MSTPVMTLREQREVFLRATTPGGVERLWLAATFGTLAVAVGLAVFGVVLGDARLGWSAFFTLFMAGGVGEVWYEKRRARLQMRPAIVRNRPAAVRLALYVLQPQFDDIDVLADSEVIEVLADPFMLNAAERDFEFDARLGDARVRYERVNDYVAHLHRWHSDMDVS